MIISPAEGSEPRSIRGMVFARLEQQPLILEDFFVGLKADLIVEGLNSKLRVKLSHVGNVHHSFHQVQLDIRVVTSTLFQRDIIRYLMQPALHRRRRVGLILPCRRLVYVNQLTTGRIDNVTPFSLTTSATSTSSNYSPYATTGLYQPPETQFLTVDFRVTLLRPHINHD